MQGPGERRSDTEPSWLEKVFGATERNLSGCVGSAFPFLGDYSGRAPASGMPSASMAMAACA